MSTTPQLVKPNLRTSQWLSNLVGAALARPVAFHPMLSRISGSVTAGLFLSQALYWSEKTDNTDGWFWKSIPDWTSETTLSKDEQKTARNKLMRLDLIQEHHGEGNRVFYRVNKDRLAELVQSFAEFPQFSMRKPRGPESGKSANRKAGFPQTGELETRQPESGIPANRGRKSRNPYKEAEITSESTAEITTEISSETSTESVPPTPLAQAPGGDSYIPEKLPGQTNGEQSTWAVVMLQLKGDLNAEWLKPAFKDQPNQFDQYFRDTWQKRVEDGGVLVLGAEYPDMVRQGLKLYARRIAQIFRSLIDTVPSEIRVEAA